jgi:orotidine-5'-phosphate decarboxylase
MSENRNFRELLEAQWAQGNFVCVGLDSELDKIPKSVLQGNNGCHLGIANTIIRFNREIVRATKDFVCAYKPNMAFYEAHGAEGMIALQHTIANIHEDTDVPVILDAKRGDIGNTNGGYVAMAFDYLKVDAITVHPYLGREALQPFLDCKDKGIIVLCRTSNPGAGEFQDLEVPKHGGDKYATMPLYQYVAEVVSKYWNKNGNCALVVGATYPAELKRVREIVGDLPILIPGIGAQGGDVEKTVSAGKDSNGKGMIVNSSRGIIFASSGPDFAIAARNETRRLHDLIIQYR